MTQCLFAQCNCTSETTLNYDCSKDEGDSRVSPSSLEQSGNKMDNEINNRIASLELRMNQHAHSAMDSTTVLAIPCFIQETLPGTTAQTAGNYKIFFTAPFQCTVVGIAQVHGTANGAACTLQVERLEGTTAAGSGTNLLNTAFDLNATANTPQYAGLRGGGTLIQQTGLGQGDRLALKIASGALSGIVNLNVTVYIVYAN